MTHCITMLDSILMSVIFKMRLGMDNRDTVWPVAWEDTAAVTVIMGLLDNRDWCLLLQVTHLHLAATHQDLLVQV